MSSSGIWVGIDAGADQSWICAINNRGVSLREARVETSLKAVTEFLSGLKRRRLNKIAIEAGSTGLNLIRGLMAAGYPVAVYETQKLSRFLRVRFNKTDTNDARGLAELARFGETSVSEVHIKSQECQRIRSLLAFRHKLIVQRVMLEGMLRALFRLNGGKLRRGTSITVIDKSVISEVERIKEETGIDLSPDAIPVLAVVKSLRLAILHFEKQIKAWALSNQTCVSFMKIPGVGPICAVAFYTQIEKPERFERPVDVGPYLGLTPKVMQSGTTLKHGRISRQGNKLTRSCLTIAAGIHMQRAPNSRLSIWAKRIRDRASPGKARVALARKLGIAMLAMWKSGTEFDPSLHSE